MMNRSKAMLVSVFVVMGGCARINILPEKYIDNEVPATSKTETPVALRFAVADKTTLAETRFVESVFFSESGSVFTDRIGVFADDERSKDRFLIQVDSVATTESSGFFGGSRTTTVAGKVRPPGGGPAEDIKVAYEYSDQPNWMVYTGFGLYWGLNVAGLLTLWAWGFGAALWLIAAEVNHNWLKGGTNQMTQESVNHLYSGATMKFLLAAQEVVNRKKKTAMGSGRHIASSVTVPSPELHWRQ